MKPPPGIVIAHTPAGSGVYIGSPSLALLPDGTYVAGHDDFGPGSAADTTTLFQSPDRGQSWTKWATVSGQYWSTLFVHHGDLYLIGTSQEYGDVVLRRSRDGGRTWTQPQDGRSGLLLTGGQYHCAPVPVVAHAGRIWRAMERREPPVGWAEHFSAFVLSVPEEADLLDARQWRVTQSLRYNLRWPFCGWLEGNVVVTPSGDLVDMLRTDARGEEVAAAVQIGGDGRTLRFNPPTDLVQMPGACKKFTIRYDSASRRYWSLTNHVPRPAPGDVPGAIRNTLALVCSSDLKDWEARSVLLHHPDPLRHGFQYADWHFDGEDIVAVVRTAYDDGQGGAHNFHDANFLTFHRVPHFRELVSQDPL